MKRTSLLFVLAAALASAPLGARGVEAVVHTTATDQAQNGTRPVSLEEVKNLSNKEVGSDIIIKLLQSHPSIYNLNANDVIDLKEAGVKSEVIDYMLSTSRHMAASAPTETTATTAPSAATAPLVPQTAPTDQGYDGYAATYPYSYPYNYYPYNYYYPPYYYGFGFGAPFTFFFDGHSHDHHGDFNHHANFAHSSGFHGGAVPHGGGFHGGAVHSSGFHGGAGSHGGGGHGGGHH